MCRARSSSASLAEPLEDERGQIAQSRRLPFLPFQHRTELRLTARSPQKQDETFRDRHRNGVAMVCLDERQHQIDTGRDASRRPHTAIAKKDVIVDDAGLGESAPQLVDVMPVRRRPAAVGQAGLGEHERPGADGDERRAAPPMRPQPADGARF